jgi:uncharacterized membrane protein YvlD (DUF360 family)
MNYVRSLFLNFLFVFFVDRVVPGIEITYFEQVPNIGADILFSIVVGFLNATIYPFLALLELSISKLKLACFSFVISFGAFTAIALVPFGIQVVSPLGWILGGGIVWVVSFVTNYMEWQHDLKRE